MAQGLSAAVLAFIAAMEANTGVPIAILERMDKTELFWARTAQILCAKTREEWCERDVRFMTSNTEPLGISRIIEYKGSDGSLKRVCAIIPPFSNIEPSLVSEAFGQGYPTTDMVPTQTETWAWLMLYHATHCLDGELSDAEERRATAAASLGLTLLQGHPTFTAGMNRSPSRKMAVLSGHASAYWGAGTGERILLDLWKEEVAERLRKENDCYVIVRENTSIDIESIQRDRQLPQNMSCGRDDENGNRSSPVTVSDSNLWLWMYGDNNRGGMGAPPITYSPMKPFPSMEDGAAYVIETANGLAVTR